MAASKKSSAKAEAAALSCPEDVLELFSSIKNKTIQQLFDSKASKRLAAVNALREKCLDDDIESRLILASALVEPEASVRVAMLALLERSANRMPWQQVVQLRANARRFIDDGPEARVWLACCFASAGVPLERSDLQWLDAMLDEPALPYSIYRVPRLVRRAVLEDVDRPRALVLFARLLRDPRTQSDALTHVRSFGAHAHALIPALIAIVDELSPARTPARQSRGDSAHEDWTRAWQSIALLGPSAHNDAALLALERARAAMGEDAWTVDVAMGLLDHRTLAARIEAHRAQIEAPRHGRAFNPDYVVVEALVRDPESCVRYASTITRSLFAEPSSFAPEVMDHFVVHAPHETALALEPFVRDPPKSTIYRRVSVSPFRWWDRLRPQTAPADAGAIIARSVAAFSREPLEWGPEEPWQAACSLIERVAVADNQALVSLAALGAAFAALDAKHPPPQVRMVLPIVRAMHAIRAGEEDFTPIVAVYSKMANASDRRAKKASAGADLAAISRAFGRAIVSLSSIESVRRAFDAFEVLSSTAETFGDALQMLEPFLFDPDVRAYFERALSHHEGWLQRQAASSLGLLQGE